LFLVQLYYFGENVCQKRFSFSSFGINIHRNTLHNVKLIDNDLCDICSNEIEDIMHLFVKCTELYYFHMYVSKQVEELFENCDSDQKNYIVYEEIFILGITD
jgi:hypothetical protein